MSDAYNDCKNKGDLQWRIETHPDHFMKSPRDTSGDIAVRSDAQTTAIKHDNDKPEYHHFSPIFLEEVAKILTFGGKKYTEYNWRAGFKWSRPFNAAMRHLWAWWGGQDKDSETGLSHLAHAVCCIMMLLEFEQTKKELDNRYKPKET